MAVLDGIIHTADAKCLLCHRYHGKEHSLTRCGVSHRAGYVISFDPPLATKNWTAIKAENAKNPHDPRKGGAAGSASVNDRGRGGRGGGMAQVPGDQDRSSKPSDNRFADFEDKDSASDAASSSSSDLSTSVFDPEDSDFLAPPPSSNTQRNKHIRKSTVSKPKSSLKRYHIASRSVACASASSVSVSVNSVRPPIPTARKGSVQKKCVADTGATHTMIPWYDAFVSYHKAVSGEYVLLAGNQQAPILGRGTAVFYLNGQLVKIRNVLHVPSLRIPLYSLRAHRKIPGCGFIGDDNFLVWFPNFVLEVDASVDSHLDFSLPDSDIITPDYEQPRASRATKLPAPQDAHPSATIPNLIEDDDDIAPADVAPSLTTLPPSNLTDDPDFYCDEDDIPFFDDSSSTTDTVSITDSNASDNADSLLIYNLHYPKMI